MNSLNNFINKILFFTFFLASGLFSNDLIVNYKDSLEVNKGELIYKLKLNAPGFKNSIPLKYSQFNESSIFGQGFALDKKMEVALCKIDSSKKEDKNKLLDLKYATNYCLDGKKLYKYEHRITPYTNSNQESYYLKDNKRIIITKGINRLTKKIYWSFILENGMEYTYNTSSSNEKNYMDFENSTTSFSLLLSYVKDRNGNKTKYNYINIHNRKYLKSISYKNQNIIFNYTRSNKYYKLYYDREISFNQKVKSIDFNIDRQTKYTYDFYYTNNNIYSITMLDQNNNSSKPINFIFNSYKELDIEKKNLFPTRRFYSNSDKYFLEKIIKPNNYTKEIRYTYPDSYDINLTKFDLLVKSLTMDNSSGTKNHISYEYENYNKKNNKINFSKITKIDDLLNKKIESYYDTHGNLIKIKKTINDLLIEKLTYKYNLKPRVFRIGNNTISSTTPLLFTSERNVFDLNSNFLYIVTESFIYDNFEKIIYKKTFRSNNNSKYTKIIESDYLYNNKLNFGAISKKTIKKKLYPKSKQLMEIFNYQYDNKGKLLSKTINIDDKTKTYKYTYDNSGNKKSEKFNSRISYFEYDNLNRLKLSRNSLGHAIKYKYNNSCNLPSEVIDVNNLSTKIYYDSLCRKVKEISPEGTITKWLYKWDKSLNFGSDYQSIGFGNFQESKSSYKVTKSNNLGQWEEVYYDNLDKVLRKITMGSNGKVYEDFVYNKRGLLKAKTRPYYKGSFPEDNTNWTIYEYDEKNRKIKTSLPHKDGRRVTEYKYDGLKTSIYLPDGTEKIIYNDILGNKIKTIHNDSVISYTYNANLLLTQTNTNGKIINIKYDGFKNKISLNDPSTGLIKYEYNLYNQLTKQINADGKKIEISYDKIGRIIKQIQDNDVIIFEYDKSANGIGKVSLTKNNVATKTFSYDKYSRLINENVKIEKQSFTTALKYNEKNQISNITYPSGLSVNREYELNGMIKQLSIPKKDIWDYNYTSLESNFKKVLDRIVELQQKAKVYEDKTKEYMRKSLTYKYYANRYKSYSNSYLKESQKLNYISNEIQKKVDYYQSVALRYRKLASHYFSEFGHETFKYVKTINGKHYYTSLKCKKTWKGRCFKRNKISLPSWMSDEQYQVRGKRGKSYWKTRPQSEINVSSVYNKWANYYQNLANREKRKLNIYKNRSESLNQRVNNYQKLANQNIKKANEYLIMARSQSDTSRYIINELQNQLKVKDELENMLLNKLEDNSNVVIWTATQRDSVGRVEGELYGNGLLSYKTFDQYSGVLNRVTTGVGSKLIRDINYEYNVSNSVISRVDELNNINEYYEYDEYDRLVSWEKNNNQVTYEYDIFGNMTYNSEIGYMEYNNRNQILKRDGYNYAYDNSGNMTSDSKKYLAYNSFNKVSSIITDDNIIKLNYDSFNNLTIKKDKNKTIYYINDYEYEVSKNSKNQDVITMRHNLTIEGKVVAIHEKTKINNQKQVDKTAYIHRDALNSVDMLTDAHGEVIIRKEYSPFGKVVKTITKKNMFDKSDIRGFTGHKHINQTNLIDMGGRMYDSTIGRFTSPDIFIQNAGNFQNYNRYSYVMNNPLKYTDPTGYAYEDENSPDDSGYDSSQESGAGVGAGEQNDNQAGENGHNGGLGSGDGGNDDNYWDWYNQKIKEQQKAEEERKAREEAERIAQERDRKNQEDVNNAVEVASTVNDLFSGVLGNMKDAHVRSVGSVAPGFFGAFFDAYQVFSAKTNYQKGKTVAGALTSAATGFAWGIGGTILGTIDNPGFGTIFGGAAGTVAGAIAGEKMGEDFYDSAFSDYKDEINSW